MLGGIETRERAFSELYARHSSRIYAYCRYVFRDREQAEDIFQETFMRFFESAQKDREVENVPAYLLIIARNLCLNAKRDKRDTVTLEDYHQISQDRSLERKEMLELIDTAMELLPDDYREAFFLREYEDMPYAEIANILNTTPVTVRIRVTRARQKIREILEPYIAELSQ